MRAIYFMPKCSKMAPIYNTTSKGWEKGYNISDKKIKNNFLLS